MKLGLAVAPEAASPLAFVVLRGKLEIVIEKAADLGFDGIELALADPKEVDVKMLKDLLNNFRLEIPVISTGRVYAERKLSLSHLDPEIRYRAREVIKSFIDIASEFNARVNIGRVRGMIDGEVRDNVEVRFMETIIYLLNYARSKGVELIIEPINRYESDFINTLEEGLEYIKRFNEMGFNNVGLMPDLFHMNIEEKDILESLNLSKDKISYIHFADSNRYAPGYGHLDFPSIIKTLKEINYDDYITLEILPKPDSVTAASKGVKFLKNIMERTDESKRIRSNR